MIPTHLDASRPARPHRLGTVLAALALAAVVLGGCGDDGAGEVTLSPDAAEGRAIAREAGCMSCHGADGGGQVGPAWVGLAGSEVSLADGSTVVADTGYLTRAIAEPDADLVDGYTVRMPVNDLDSVEVALVVAYIEELR